MNPETHLVYFSKASFANLLDDLNIRIVHSSTLEFRQCYIRGEGRNQDVFEATTLDVGLVGRHRLLN